MPPRRRRTRWSVDSYHTHLSVSALVGDDVVGCKVKKLGGSCIYLLNVVIAQSTAIFKLLAGEDETLLVGWDAFLVLDLGLDVVDGVGGLDFESDGLARKGLDEAGQRVSIQLREGKMRWRRSWGTGG